MAKEAWTLVYNIQASGQKPAEWAEKDIKVKSKEKNAGRIAVAGQPQKASEPFINIYPRNAKVVTIEAEGGPEAAEALRAFYGPGIETDVCLAAKASSLAETKFIT